MLVGLDRPDDAGVYRLSDDVALVVTVDFFTPIVDDPATFGRIAATNALSDVYAMGGRPISALNVVCFPSKTLDPGVLHEILAGGLVALSEAGCPLVGGHSVDDPELKYGLSVTGVVHPDRVLASSGGRDGDALVLTKPLGAGLVSTAEKRRRAPRESSEACIAMMTTLNRDAAERMLEHDARACTDVTGFGFLGHAYEMIEGSSLDLHVDTASVPLLPHALELAEAGMLCGGLGRNQMHYGPNVDFADGVSSAWRSALFDPQTSGGLLIALPDSEADALVADLAARGHRDTARVGHVRAGSGRIHVR